jgi:hypothetical protein
VGKVIGEFEALDQPVANLRIAFVRSETDQPFVETGNDVCHH